MRRWGVRWIAAAVLVVVGGTGLVVAGTGWWLERSFLDTGSFTDTANELLDQEAVQAELSAILVRSLSRSAGADLQIAQPFLATIVTQVVDSTPFRAVFDDALSGAHQVLVDRDTERILLDLTAAYDLIKDPLVQVAPDLADDVPSRRELEVVLVRRSQLTAAWDVIDAVKRAVALVALGALVAVAAGVSLTPRGSRLRALARVAWVVVSASVVLLAALLTTRYVVRARIDDGVLADAVDASLRVIMSGLVVQTVVIAVVAAMAAVAASYTARKGVGAWRGAAADIGNWARGVVPAGAVDATTVVRWRLPPPSVPSRAAYAARAGLLGGLGLFVMLEPAGFGRVLAFVAGVVALVLGVSELLAAREVSRIEARARREAVAP